MLKRLGVVHALLVVKGVCAPTGDSKTGTPWWLFVYDPDSNDRLVCRGDFVMGVGVLPFGELTDGLRVVGYDGVVTPNLMKVGLDMRLDYRSMRRWVSAKRCNEEVDWDIVYSGIGVDLGLQSYLVYWSLMGCPLGRVLGGGIRWDERVDGGGDG